MHLPGLCAGPARRLIPNAFSFTAVTNANISTVYEASATIAGFNGAILVNATNGEVRTNGAGSWGASTVVWPGDTLNLRRTSSANWGTAVNASVEANGQTATFTITTQAVSTFTWDTGEFTTGDWAWNCPPFNQIWAIAWGPGGGGGGQMYNIGYWVPGYNGEDASYAQWYTSVDNLIGYGGHGGQGELTDGYCEGYGADGSPGDGYGGNSSNTTGGGYAGGAGAWSNTCFPARGGNGGNGGNAVSYFYKGQIALGAGISVHVSGGGGGGYYNGGNGQPGRVQWGVSS